MPGVKFALSDTCSSLRLLRSLNCLAWSSLWVTRAALYACFAGHTFDFWFDCGLKIRYILWHSSRKCTDNLFIKRVITVSLKWAMFNKCAISATIIFPACLILEKTLLDDFRSLGLFYSLFILKETGLGGYSLTGFGFISLLWDFPFTRLTWWFLSGVTLFFRPKRKKKRKKKSFVKPLRTFGILMRTRNFQEKFSILSNQVSFFTS